MTSLSTSKISENLFSSFGSLEENSLTSFQLETSLLFRSFWVQTTNAYTLVGITSGGLLGSFAKTQVSKIFFSRSDFLNFLIKRASTPFSCAIEAIGIQQIPFLLGNESDQEGWKGWVHLSLTVLWMKNLGSLPIGNPILRHGVQDLTLFALDSTCGAIGLIEQTKQTWVQAIVSAEIVNSQMSMGGNLLRLMAPEIAQCEAKLVLEDQGRNTQQRLRTIDSLFSASHFEFSTVTPEGKTGRFLSGSSKHPFSEKKSNLLFMAKSKEERLNNAPEWRNNDWMFEKKKKKKMTPLIDRVTLDFFEREPLIDAILETYHHSFKQQKQTGRLSTSIAEYKYEAKKYLEGKKGLTDQQKRSIIDAGTLHFPSLRGTLFTEEATAFINDRKEKAAQKARRAIIQIKREERIKKESLKLALRTPPLLSDGVSIVEIPENTEVRSVRQATIKIDPSPSLPTETKEEWDRRNKVESIKTEFDREILQLRLGELVTTTLATLKLGHRDSCRMGPINYQGLYQIKQGKIHPTLEVFYRLIGLFHKQTMILASKKESIQIASTISFYELYAPELTVLPFYERSSNALNVDLTTEELQLALETPVSRFLHKTLDERKLSNAYLIQESGIPKPRVESILAGGVYQLELSEIIAFARALRVNLDFFYLLVKKETAHFTRLVSKQTGEVLSEPFENFDGKSPPVFKEKPSLFGEKIKSYKKRWALKTDREAAKAFEILSVTYKDYLHKNTLPHLNTFYELCRSIESREKAFGKNREEIMADRVDLYLSRNPEARQLELLDLTGKQLVVHLPPLPEGEWSYADLTEITFGPIFQKILMAARKKGWQFNEIERELGIKEGMRHDLLFDAMLEIEWPVIERIDAFVAKHLDGMYHRSFLSIVANPIVLDLASEITDQNGRILRAANMVEPLIFLNRYAQRLKFYKGKEYKKRKEILKEQQL